ncbi:MAG: DNA-directed RNA polymerase subunit omega [Dethiobacteria bacterium]|jgi:DNA-directed RNA polymerase subunit omega
MINPSIDELTKIVDSKYTLVIAAAKRARQLREGSIPLVETNSKNDVTIALEEINNGLIICEYPKDY